MRNKLGSTDPNKADEGSIRADYGKDIMRNGAHASDSEENAIRERKIIGLMEDTSSYEKKIIKSYLDHVSK